MPWINSDVIARLVEIRGADDGLFVYDSSGQLVAAIVSQTEEVEDKTANPVFTSYQAGGTSVNIGGDSVNWSNGASLSGGSSFLSLSGAFLTVPNPQGPPAFETWHYPALPSGWTGLLRYRLTPRNETEIQCDITGSAAATGSIPLFTLPVSAYFPAVQAHFPLRVFCPNAPVNTETGGNVTTSGAVIALNIPAGTTNIAFCQAVPLEGTS